MIKSSPIKSRVKITQNLQNAKVCKNVKTSYQVFWISLYDISLYYVFHFKKILKQETHTNDLLNEFKFYK